MEDLERYGDYTEYEDDIPKKRNAFTMFIKIAIAVVCILVVGLLAFRIVMFNYYPQSMKTIYYNDILTEYYNSTGGEIKAKTQTIRAPYDDEKAAIFIADKLVVIEGVNQLQITLRYNKALDDDICKMYGISEVTEDTFSFALFKNNPNYDSTAKVDEYNPIFLPTGVAEAVLTDSSISYNYIRVVVDDVDFENAEWLSLAIYIDGAEIGEENPRRVAVYENNEGHNAFYDYKLSGKEHPVNE